jgi:DNA-binding MarR family transcriptional regulator
MEVSGRAATVDGLAAELAHDLDQLVGMYRSLSQPSTLSLTTAATLATLERSGPIRLTVLAAREGVTQPAMTQLITRLEESGLVRRAADPAEGGVVLVAITDAGRGTLAARRARRAAKLGAILAQLTPDHRAALTAALPALAALGRARRDDDVRNDDVRNNEVRNNDVRNDDVRNDDVRNDDVRNNDLRQEHRRR